MRPHAAGILYAPPFYTPSPRRVFSGVRGWGCIKIRPRNDALRDTPHASKKRYKFRNFPGTPNPSTFSKVLPYKWEAYFCTNGRRAAVQMKMEDVLLGLPFSPPPVLCNLRAEFPPPPLASAMASREFFYMQRFFL